MTQYVRLDKTSRWLISRDDIGSDFYKEFKVSAMMACLGTIADVRHFKEPNGPHNTIYKSTIVFADGADITITDYDNCDYYLVRPGLELQPPSIIDPITCLNDHVRYLNTLSWPNWTVMMDIISTDWNLATINFDEGFAIWEHRPSGTFYQIDSVKKVLPKPNNPQFFFQPAYEVPPEAVFTVPATPAQLVSSNNP